MPIKTKLITLHEDSGVKKENKKTIVEWKTVPMIRVQSIIASVREIVYASESSDLIKIGIVGNPDTGKSTLAACIAHLVHKLSKVPFSVRVFKKDDLLSEVKTRIHMRKFTEGKNLGRYQIKRTSWVEWNTERCPKLLVRPTFPELYLPNKLLLGRQTKVAAFDGEGYIVDNTVIVCIPYVRLKGVNNNNIKKYFSNIKKARNELEKLSQGLDLRFILGIINSRLIKYYINFFLMVIRSVHRFIF